MMQQRKASFPKYTNSSNNSTTTRSKQQIKKQAEDLNMSPKKKHKWPIGT